MDKIIVLCFCILLSAIAVLVRLTNFEEGLARAAYAACKEVDANPLRLVLSDPQ